MASDFINKNFSNLKTFHPDAYRAIKDEIPSVNYEVSLAISGKPTLSLKSKEGKNKFLISQYDPIHEARRLLESLKVGDFTNFIVVGMGLGYQLSELIKMAPDFSKIIVIETDRQFARLALQSNNFSKILAHPGLTIHFSKEAGDIKTALEEERINFTLNGYCLIQQHSFSQANPEIFANLLTELKNFFQASQIDIKTHSKRSKTFYKNISSNYPHLLDSLAIDLLKDSLPNIPAIICSAGPSLDKNIQLLKTKKDNFLLIAVATALKPLLANGIQPDFVVAVDADEITLSFFEIPNKTTNSWLVYDLAIPPTIPKLFVGKRLVYDSSVNLAQWMQKYIGGSGSLGKIFSVAHAAFQFANQIGCSPIIFTGQDLSFDKNRLHCSYSQYYWENQDKIEKLKTLEHINQIKYFNYSKNLLERKSIYDQTIMTTTAMDTYSHMFSNSISKASSIFNATEGGIGIGGVKNILLREAINSYCQKDISTQKNKVLKNTKPKSSSVIAIKNAAKGQLVLLKRLLDQIKVTDRNCLGKPPITITNKEILVKQMNSIFQKLLENKETMLLLQGYDFSGFSVWNQKTNDILKKKKTLNATEVAEKEFQRDQEFLEVLKGSIMFNIGVCEMITNKNILN